MRNKALIYTLIFNLISLIGIKAFAAQAQSDVVLPSDVSNSFYECTLPQADEFRVGIDIAKNTAGFFDNDSTSIMKYAGHRQSTSNVENSVLIYEGKDLGGSGGLRLEFNVGTKRIKLSTLETDGTIELLGYAACSLSKAWDLADEENLSN